MRRATIAKRGEPQWGSAFTGMGRRRVRWRNVARLAALLAAGALIATHGSEAPAPAPPPPSPTVALPRLADVPRLWQPKRVKRRALKRGPVRVFGLYDRKGREPPRRHGPPTPSPQPGPGGHKSAPERSAAPEPTAPEPSAAPEPTAPERSAAPEPSAPTSGEFTPDPGP